MRNAIVICFALAMMPCRAMGAFTDFSDYSQNTSFTLGQVFQSHGVDFKAVGSWQIPNTVAIFANANFASLYVGPGTSFLVPEGTQEVSFDYDDGAGMLLILNDIRPPRPGENGTPFHAGFSFLNGQTVAGVDVTTTTTFSDPAGERGTVTFRGPIDSLVISGLELTIDNVTVRIPEPSSAALLLLGLAGVRLARRWRHV